MKRVKFLLFAIFFSTFLTACSTYSGDVRATDQNIIEKIKIGKTTKNDIQGLLGISTNVMKKDGKEI